jgi:hypothetical protein
MPAILAFVTAVTQFLQVVDQDQKLYILNHQQACEIEKIVREFASDTTAIGINLDMRQRFAEFRRTVEQIKEKYGDQIFRARGQEPPQFSLDLHDAASPKL